MESRDARRAMRHLNRAQQLIQGFGFGGGQELLDPELLIFRPLELDADPPHYRVQQNPHSSMATEQHGRRLVEEMDSYRFWFIRRRGDIKMPEVLTFLRYIKSMGDIPRSGSQMGDCKYIAGIIANNLSTRFGKWKSGIMFFTTADYFISMELIRESIKGVDSEIIIHNSDPKTVAFTFDPINQIMYILDFAGGGRFDIVIGKCSDVEFFQGPSWWKDGTFFSLYGGHHNDPRSQDAKLSMDLSADDVWSLKYESYSYNSNPVNFIWNKPHQFQEAYFKTHDPDITYLDHHVGRDHMHLTGNDHQLKKILKGLMD